MLNSRQWASLAWLAILLAIALYNRQPRRSLGKVLKAALQPVILGAFLVYGVWVLLEILVGAQLGLWTQSLIVPTVIWAGTAGISTLFSFDEASENPRFLLHKARELVAATLVVDIVVNLRTFHIILEFLLQGMLGLLVVLGIYASRSPGNQSAQRFANGTLSLVGLGLLVGGVSRVLGQPEAVFTFENLRSWLLPVWLGLGLLPLIGLLGMYSNLERTFRMMGLEEQSKLKRLRNILPLVIRLGYRPSETHSFINYWDRQLALADTFREAWTVVGEYIDHRRQEAQAAQEKADRLEEFAGVEGENKFGERLDQREFEATREALRLIHDWHHGWYDNGPERYKAGKIRGFMEVRDWDGLPEDPEIQMEVNETGQAWYAWRRTVTGWVLALGARDGDYMLWYYDGAEPPTGFPRESEEWTQMPGADSSAPNW